MAVYQGAAQRLTGRQLMQSENSLMEEKLVRRVVGVQYQEELARDICSN